VGAVAASGLRDAHHFSGPLTLSQQRALRGGRPSSLLALRGGSMLLPEVADVMDGLDLLGTVVNAFSGTIAAGRVGMDLLGCAIIACVAAMGGGTLRDGLLGRLPVFWMKRPLFLQLSLLASVGTFAVYPRLEGHNGFSDRSLAVCLSDALGMSANAIIGSAAAFDLARTDLVCVSCGLMTACFGGVIRDSLCGVKPRLLHAQRSMYGTPALLGALVYTIARRASPAHEATAAILGFLLTLSMRVYCFTNQITAPPGCSKLADPPGKLQQAAQKAV